MLFPFSKAPLSLAAEQQFYLLWPLVEALLAPLWAVVWMVAIVVNQLANFGITDPRTNAPASL